MTVKGRQERSGRRRVAVLLGALFAVLVVIGLIAVARLASVADELEQARSELELASGVVRAGRVDDALESLERAEQRILAANETIRTAPELRMLRLVPGLSDNLASLEDSVEAAAVVVHGGERILRTSAPLQSEDGTLQVSLSDGSLPMEQVARARLEIRALSEQLVARSDDPSPFLVPSVRKLHEAVREEIAVRQEELARLDRGLTLLEQLAGSDRPRRFLIAVANTAEMRGAGGMMLNYGVLEGDAGTVELTDFGRVEDLVVVPPVDPAVSGLPDDYLARWDGFAVTQEWRNATMSGDLTLIAPTLLAMYQRATGLPAHGVIQVDPAGLSALLAAVGPVSVGEVGLVTAENVEALVLNEAYSLFPGVEERSDVLGDVAEAAFRRLVDGDFPSVSDLASQIGNAVDGRHLTVVADDADTQTAVEFFGADGALPDGLDQDHLHLTVQNLAGNKLDYYVDTGLEVTGERSSDAVGEIVVTISVRNDAPPGQVEPRYIFGPFDEGFVAGEYRGAVTLYVPTGTSLVEASGGPFRLEPSLQTEDGRPLVGFIVDVPAGETRETTLRLAVPPRSADDALLLIPQPRVRPTTVAVDVETGEDPIRGTVTLDRSWRLPPGARPEAVGSP